MKKLFLNLKFIKIISVLITIAVVSGLSFASAAEIPAKAELKQGVNVNANTKASVDWSNLSEGSISVKYTGGKDVRIKVQIAKSGGVTYTYDLNNAGNYETFPLVEGDGTYTVKVYENSSGTKYATVFSTAVDMTLRNEFLPFLYPNQYVNYSDDSKVTAKAIELTEGLDTDIDMLSAVYNYVVNNFTYDYEKLNTVQSGYLPDVDEILESKTGICFDYAAVMTAMLREEGVPCKLVIGYAGTIYHAWVNVYIQGKGWIDKAIYFDGEDWKLMDPTFASSGKSSPAIMQYIANTANYMQKYAY
ncbi:MAG: transglutaminase family protein [Oscillospiraceae bacterium]